MGFTVIPPSIILGAFLSTVNLVIICLPGVYFAWKGLVSQDMRRSLGHMSFNYLLPTLTFVNIAPELTASRLVLWWPLAVNIIVSCLVALLIGWASSRLHGTKPEHRKLVIAASAFGNTNSALLMLVTAMCAQENLPFFRALGQHCSPDGYAYVAIGLAACSFINFPVAVQLIKPRPPKTEDPPALEPPKGCDMEEIVIDEEAPQKVAVELTKVPTAPWSQQNEQHRRRAALTSSISAPVRPTSRAGTVSPFESLNFNGQKAAGAMGWPADGPRESRAFDRLSSFSAREAMLSATVPEEDTGTDNAPSPKNQAEAAKVQQNGLGGAKAAPDGGMYGREILPRLRQWQDSRVGKVVGTALKWFNIVAPPPTIASIIGLVVGCVPVLKSLMFPAESAPLGFFTTALSTIANAFVFLISFILGAVLSKGPGPGTRSLGWRPIIMTLLNRWLFLPVLGAVWVFGSHALGWWRSPDPLFTFIMLMTNATPSGNQVQGVCAMYHTCEVECGSMLFWQYMASIIGLPVWMALYLYLMGVFGFL